MNATLAPPPPLDLKVAKDELARIDQILLLEGKWLLLIGGLAVQQYHHARATRDIDLVASHETIRYLLDKLYKTKYWTVTNTGSDDRPSLIIKNKHRPINVYLGAKIIERGEYDMIPWSSLTEQINPFRYHGDTYLQQIRIPLPHALAYSKIIAFIARYNTRQVKAIADLQDVVNLSNNDDFYISRLFNLINKNNAATYIQDEMAKLTIQTTTALAEILGGSCLSYFANICPARQAAVGNYNQSMTQTKKHLRSAYFAAPHKNIKHNTAIANELRKIGIGVKVPYDEVKSVYGTGMPRDRSRIREICIEAIRSSDFLVVDADRYGLDSAWELGFADGLGKYVIGLNEDLSLMTEPRMINRRIFRENFMHGWDEQPIFFTAEELEARYSDKVVYICGPFKNEALSNIKQDLESRVRKVILPMDYVPDANIMPKDYPLQTRANAVNQIDEADVLLVILPRYGMDSSWQIGYATAKRKEIIGIMTPDDNASGAYHSLWDHWMHGWREKDILTGVPKLCAAMNGFIDAEII